AGVGPAEAPAYLDRLAALGLPDPAPAGIDRLRRLGSLLHRAGVADRVRLDLSIVRGLAYYTGPVFEAFDRSGGERSLLGGGRYDRLIELFGGEPTPACGLALGDQTLELLLRAHGRWPEGEPALDTYVVAVTQDEGPLAIEWVGRLRRAGRSADCDLMGRSLSRQLKEAARRRARRAILLGPRELARGVLLERDLATGAQRERAPEEVLAGE
ncbi:MAG: ATP phosphoribosyltransferase regulatory subunit, partial [Thermoplasmata archaeon]